jgi:hypothetical protein
MTQRRLILLFVVSLIVLGLAVWVTHREQNSGASLAGARVLPGLRARLNTVTEVRISGPNGKHVVIEKGAKHWLVSQRHYPANTGQLRKLLIDLSNLRVVQTKTRLAKNYPLLGVQPVTAKGATGVRIEVISPRRTWSLIVGHSALQGSATYVRRVGHKQTLLATPLIMTNAKAAQWLEPVILDVAAKRVRSIEERLAGQPPYSIVRAKPTDTNFTVLGIPPGRRISSPAAADEDASALSNLTLTNVHKALAPPPGAALSRALFTTFGGLRLTVTGYRTGKKGPCHIDIAASGTGTKALAEAKAIEARVHGWTYTIPSYEYRQIFQQLSGLLQPLPKPRRP